MSVRQAKRSANAVSWVCRLWVRSELQHLCITTTCWVSYLNPTYRAGGLDQANKDFDALGPQNFRNIDTPFGPGRAGTLPDGRQVNVRPGSSNGGPPTLEVQKGKNITKFRFNG